MSAILSAADLNDFISPGVACIKPVETLPKQAPTTDSSSSYEVTTEDKLPAAADAPPASISLTDCLACSGCVTSAEAVLVSLQSHNEVLSMLEKYPAVHSVEEMQARIRGDVDESDGEGRIFIASVSPQTRASIAAAFDITERAAGIMISQLLSGTQGLKSGGRHGSSFTWVVDTNTVRSICQAAVTEEVLSAVGMPSLQSTVTHPPISSPKLPILASACPGWICYAEKTHPHVLPYLSALRSPQAMAGVLMKTVLARKYGIPPSRIYHVSVMPCFDKKLEASRAELMDTFWQPTSSSKPTTSTTTAIRDTDTVITARELLMLAASRNVSLPSLPQTPYHPPTFPDAILSSFLFPTHASSTSTSTSQSTDAGPSGGYAYTILHHLQHSGRYPNSQITLTRGRNIDVVEYSLVSSTGAVILRTARYFGFRNIQNLVRKLKPAKKSRMPGTRGGGTLGGAENKRSAMARAGGGGRLDGGNARGAELGGAQVAEFAYVEVMACPGGCTNGGGQIKVDDELVVGAGVEEIVDVGSEQGDVGGALVTKSAGAGPAEHKEWLKRVDEAYYSADSSEASDEEVDEASKSTNGTNGTRSTKTNGHLHPTTRDIPSLLQHWSSITALPLEKLLFTTYRQVESDVGKEKGQSDMERVAGLAGSLGGGW